MKTKIPKHPKKVLRVSDFDKLKKINSEMLEGLKRIANHFDMDGLGKDSWKTLALEMADVATKAIKKATDETH